MNSEKRITAADLMSQLEAILEDISQRATVYIVEIEGTNWRGHHEFVLGPPSVCGDVVGLVDEEYGWPALVMAADISHISHLAPAYRRHPFIYRDKQCLAVGIQMSEYEQIKALRKG
jgi:hypothetical protein